MMRRAAGYTAQLSVPRVTTILSCLQPRGTFSRIPASCAREETLESRGMPCLFLNTERGFGIKPPQKSGFRRHLAGSKMLKETFFTAISRWRVVLRRARCLGFLAGVAESAGRPRQRPAHSRQHRIWCRQEMACSGKPCRQSANLTPVPCSSTSKRSPLASTNSAYISGIQHIDLIRQYRGAGVDLLINGDRNDGETRVLFASDVMPHFA